MFWEQAKSKIEASGLLSDRFADIVKNVNLTLKAKATLVVPDLSLNEKRDFLRIFKILTKYQDIGDLKSVSERDLMDQNVDPITYTIAKSPDLYAKASQTAKSRKWTQAEVMRFLGAVRYYINDRLSELLALYPCPSVSRAQLLRKTNDKIIAGLSEIADNAAKALHPFSPGAPSLAGILIKNANYDPAGIIPEALCFRDMGGELRSYLSQKLSQHKPGSPDWGLQFSNERDRLVSALDKELHPNKRPSFWDAIQFQITPPFVSASVKDIRKWWVFKKMRERVVVLTELSKEMAFSDGNDEAFAKFLRNCSKYSKIQPN